MTPDQFTQLIKRKQTEMETLINDQLPRRIGKMAVDHFRDNFIKGGFVDNGINKWDKPKRFSETGKYAAQKYATLLSARKELYNSISYNASKGLITIKSDKPYSQIHNEGGEVNNAITITPEMRKFAWAKHYEATGGTGNSKWKSLALTKKETINVHFTMPKRQFIGKSQELLNDIETMIQTQLNKILSH